jgi:hypothetical protein
MDMTFSHALRKLVGHPRWWWFDYHGSDREPDAATRQRVQAEAIELAHRWDGPSMLELARNAVSAASRALVAALTGQPVKVSREVHDERQAICSACDFYDAAQAKCTKCGCKGAKLWLATERCPLPEPKWDRIEGES